MFSYCLAQVQLGSIFSEAILVFPKDVVDFGFYAVS